MFDLQKVGQGYRVHFPQLRLSMANVKIYKCPPYVFFVLALTISQKKKIDLQKVGHGDRVQLSQLHHSMVNVKINNCLPYIFVLALTVSEL